MKICGYRQFLLSIIMFLFAGRAFLLAQETPPLKTDADNQNLIAEMERQIPELMEKADIPGMSIAVIKDGKIIWTKEAIAIFKLNVDAYPGSANVYDSLAEAYMNDGDIDLAIKYYKKTLEMIPKDTKADKTLLENLKKGATENLTKLEEKKKKKE